MKALYVPVSILVLFLFFSLWGSAYIQNQTDTWIAAVEDISIPLEKEHWHEIESRILTIHRDWEHSQKFFHLILTHQDLDEAEKYFAGALAACHENDSVELRIHLAQLSSQFVFLRSTQTITLKNIL